MANVYMGTDIEDFIFGEGTVYESESSEIPEEGATVESKTEIPEEGATAGEAGEAVEEVTVTDEELNASGVIECVDDPEVACYRIALENEQNYNKIMNAFMLKEFSVLESSGSEMIYEAVHVERFFELVKKTIQNWWSKIQGVIKNVMDKVANATDLNLQFVKKYKGKDIKTPTKDKEFKGYDFSKAKTPNYLVIAGTVGITVNPNHISKVSEEEATEFLNKFKSDFDQAKNKMRGLACGKDSVSADDFNKELKIAFFGSEDKVDVKLVAFADLLKDLENAKLVKAAAKHTYSSAQDSVKELLKRVKMAEAELKKADRKNAGMKIARCLTDAINASLGIMSKTMSMDTKAMVTKVNQDRAMAMFYVMNQPKAEKAKEKVEHNSATEIDGLNVEII